MAQVSMGLLPGTALDGSVMSWTPSLPSWKMVGKSRCSLGRAAYGIGVVPLCRLPQYNGFWSTATELVDALSSLRLCGTGWVRQLPI